MDKWMQKLALIILLVVAGLCFYGSTKSVSCWPPKEFTTEHMQYMEDTCSRGDALTWKNNYDNLIPRRDDEEMKPWPWAEQIDSKSNWLLKLVLVEFILVSLVLCFSNLLVEAGSFDAKSSQKDLHQSHCKAPLYVLIQVIAGFGWLIFAILTLLHNDWPLKQPSFLCGFNIRVLGNIQRYTVQCVGQDDNIIRAAFMLNFGLALVMTLTKAMHVVSAFFIGPFLRLKGARDALMERGVIKNPGQLGVGFAVSDLYFAMLVGGEGFVFPSGEQGKSGKDAEAADLAGTD